ncbi:uncharacterized protein B0P05DRAFT_535358 [Gilbertella persicaria]|uniref:3',5'-cyclic-nucleotide phosphodiesterase (PDEase) (3':5'-CNP) n=1 Tax=Rhizopus stolonifer TaxID=4846 RepID=A0A367KQQ7_RHIST|nr:uncharacterized protein B0P05DRAFT_535358 [Gilbertella persicaria]KAI8084378.1 hypothetical protein B0P05DRAFT_535358 [Gilbertella persicaria]RCI04526.1 3',5'-cyclic-nucleotide phosphodiesterase (PDEase) (3':5'-CNP) [Rhizopus stolonifer]
MSLAIINNNTAMDEFSLNGQPSLDPHRRQIIKRKVLAIGKMSRSYTVLKEHPQLVQQLKALTNGRLPVGTLASGEKGIREAIIQKTMNNGLSKLKEQKDLSSNLYHHHQPNYKVASREGQI